MLLSPSLVQTSLISIARIDHGRGRLAPQRIPQAGQAIHGDGLGEDRHDGEFEDRELSGLREDSQGDDHRRRPGWRVDHAEENHQPAGAAKRERDSHHARQIKAGLQRRWAVL